MFFHASPRLIFDFPFHCKPPIQYKLTTLPIPPVIPQRRWSKQSNSSQRLEIVTALAVTALEDPLRVGPFDSSGKKWMIQYIAHACQSWQSQAMYQTKTYEVT